MSFPFDFELETFPADEAAYITGTSPVVQRDLRRRGFIDRRPDDRRQARFDVFGLAELLYYTTMAKAGVGPTTAKRHIAHATQGIAFQALAEEHAFAGDYPNKGTYPGAISVLEQKSPYSGTFKRTAPARFLIRWANGETKWFPEVSVSPFDELGDAETGGPVIILDQARLGGMLLRRAGIPLVTVHKGSRS